MYLGPVSEILRLCLQVDGKKRGSPSPREGVRESYVTSCKEHTYTVDHVRNSCQACFTTQFPQCLLRFLSLAEIRCISVPFQRFFASVFRLMVRRGGSPSPGGGGGVRESYVTSCEEHTYTVDHVRNSCQACFTTPMTQSFKVNL